MTVFDVTMHPPVLSCAHFLWPSGTQAPFASHRTWLSDGKDAQMKIKYKFLDGTVTEVEVSEDIGIVIQESRRKEHADNERHRYHAAFSLNNAVYEGKIFSSGGELAGRLIRQ